MGFSGQALLVMGPVVADAQAQLQQQMVKYLKAEEEDGITVSPMYERLQTLSSPMAMVAQAQALPEKFVAPFTLGAPKDTDPSQVVIAADMEVRMASCRFRVRLSPLMKPSTRRCRRRYKTIVLSREVM